MTRTKSTATSDQLNKTVSGLLRREKLAGLFISAACGVAFAVMLRCTSKYGAGMTHDSAAYVHAARTLAEGRGLKYFAYPSPFVQWPPLYPAIISASPLAGIDTVLWLRLLCAAMYGLTIAAAGAWLFKRLKSALLSSAAVVLLLVSPPLLRVFSSAWSETVFVPLSILFFIYLSDYLSGYSIRKLIAAAIFCSLACLTRYIGVTLLLTGLFFLLLNKNHPGKKPAHIALFLFISGAPASGWLLRNYLLTGTLTGVRLPSSTALAENAALALKTLQGWFCAGDGAFAVLSAAAAAAGAMAATILFIKRLVNKTGSPPTVRRLQISPALPLVFFLALYTVYIVASASGVSFDPIGDRYMIPVYVPLVLTLFYLADRLDERGYGAAAGPVTLSLILWAAASVGPAVEETRSIALTGAGGYYSETWRNNGLLLMARELDSQTKIYSNNPGALLVLEDIKAEYTPRKSGIPAYRLEGFKASVRRSGGAYIAWFDGGAPPTMYTPSELAEYFRLERVGSVPGGVLYHIEIKTDTEDI